MMGIQEKYLTATHRFKNILVLILKFESLLKIGTIRFLYGENVLWEPAK